MSNLNFDQFINALGRETVNNINTENKRKPTVVKTETKNISTHSKVNVEPKNIVIEEDDKLNEEFFEKALDYANIVLKSVRKSFGSRVERKKVCESIRNAMNFYLEESIQPPIQKTSAPIRTMTETEWNNTPVIQESLPSQKININTAAKGDHYYRDMNIGLDENKEIDLSKVSQADIDDFKSLAGIAQ